MNDRTNLNNDDLSEVTGGASNETQRRDNDRACQNFKCLKCHGGLKSHYLWDVGTQTRDVWVCRKSSAGLDIPEWPGHRINCAFCEYFKRISGNQGECTR